MENEELINQVIRNFPSVEEVKRKLDLFKQLTPSFKKLGELYEYHEKEIGIKFIIGKDHEKETLNNFPIYRVRNNIDEKIEDITAIKTFSYPPKVKFLNRANIPGYSVFYGSTGKNTAVVETGIELGAIIYFSEWEVNVDRNFSMIEFLDGSKSEGKYWKALKDGSDLKAPEFIREKDADKVEQFMMVYNFWNEIFGANEKTYYKLSAYMAFELLYLRKVDCILYASVAQNYVGVNMIFHPSFIDKYFKLKRVYKYQITYWDGNEVKMGIISRGDVIDNKVKWGTEDDLTDEDDNYMNDLSENRTRKND